MDAFMGVRDVVMTLSGGYDLSRLESLGYRRVNYKRSRTLYREKSSTYLKRHPGAEWI